MNDAMKIVEADALVKSLRKSVDQIERQILDLSEGYADLRSQVENVARVMRICDRGLTTSKA